MKVTLFALTLFTAFCGTLCAQTEPQAVVVPGRPKITKTPSAQPVNASTTRSNLLAHTGGMLFQPASGPNVLFLNTQTRVPAEALGVTASQIQRFIRLSTRSVAKPTGEPIKEALHALGDTNTAAVVAIGDAPGYPALLVAPESRWVLVNVAALAADKPADELLIARTQKEVWRAVGYVMGAANSTGPHCLLKPVQTPADLDALETQTLCPEPFSKITAYAKKLGMSPVRMTSYRKAVEEGWASAPTNDVQRAIWNELKK